MWNKSRNNLYNVDSGGNNQFSYSPIARRIYGSANAPGYFNQQKYSNKSQFPHLPNEPIFCKEPTDLSIENYVQQWEYSK